MNSQNWRIWATGLTYGAFLGAAFSRQILEGLNRLSDALDTLAHGRPETTIEGGWITGKPAEK